jgi:phosphoribosylaminoimidazole-succinocarboxamide synthase
MTAPPTVTRTSLPLPLVRQGKVREVYQVDDATLLLVASDRVSAFDVVLAEAVPRKGAVLTQMSAYWFRALSSRVASHFITADTDEIIRRLPALAAHRAEIAGRSMLCRRTAPVPFECVVRGYLSGSAWAEYRAHGTLAGEALPGGLVESARLDPPIFSPATKAETGHDENITFSRMREALGAPLADRLRELSLSVYQEGREQAARRGIIIADTKFEFGQTPGGELLLIDEVLTPDSSRFWPADQYQPGRGQVSFDKQPLRDYLDGLRRARQWDGQPPPPPLPAEVIRATSIRYQDAYLRTAVLAVLLILAGTRGGWWIVALAVWAPVAVWLPVFFRDPPREGPRGDHLVIAPADGEIVSVMQTDEPTFIRGPAIRISIFMNIFSVHVNRYPADGTVQLRDYRPGRFLNATLDKASEHNERMSLGLSTARGPVLVRQIAGLIARRIVTDHEVGTAIRQGDRLGMIRFGSRVDTFVPVTATPRVRVGEYAAAGVTVLAEYK